jgi:mRNA interferase MazF
MMIMTDYDFGDVVLVPFPFTDQATMKKRPAVVASSSVYNRKRPDIVRVAVTSQLRPSALFGEVVITQWKDAGLLKPSIIKPIFATIEKDLLFRKLGRLGKEDRKVLRETLIRLLGE